MHNAGRIALKDEGVAGPELVARWTEEQAALAARVVERDPPGWTGDWNLLGGLDISFIIGESATACAGYVVLDRRLEVVWRETVMVSLTTPYIPGYLAFREAAPLLELVTHQREVRPDLTPTALLVDGNGVLHPRLCGVACHIGLATGLPTVGVAKSLHQLPELGPQFSRMAVQARLAGPAAPPRSIELTTTAGRVLAAAVLPVARVTNPVFVSVGSGLSLAAAVALVSTCARHRVPEPVRQADILSREYLRLHHPTTRQQQQSKLNGKKRNMSTNTNNE